MQLVLLALDRFEVAIGPLSQARQALHTRLAARTLAAEDVMPELQTVLQQEHLAHW